MAIIIADSGSTKCEWLIASPRKKQSVITQGLSPYFLSSGEIENIVRTELVSRLDKQTIDAVYFYGTGCKSPANARMVQRSLQLVFPKAEIGVSHDLMGAARGLCGDTKGIACILGTGSNSCYYDGKRIVRNSPGLGYVLGDEGSGAYLGKKVIQYYLYDTFDPEMTARFNEKYKTNAADILEKVYKKPLPNRYLASFSLFLSENRGHYMIENILEDGLTDFFTTHIQTYRETQKYPVHFVGGIAYNFKDVIMGLCSAFEMELGSVCKNPIEGLLGYHIIKN